MKSVRALSSKQPESQSKILSCPASSTRQPIRTSGLILQVWLACMQIFFRNLPLISGWCKNKVIFSRGLVEPWFLSPDATFPELICIHTGKKNTRREPLNTGQRKCRTLKDTLARYIFTLQSNLGNQHGSNTSKWLKFLTKANCRPMFPIVITPAKKIQGNQERMYRKSGEVYLCREEKK